MDKHILIGNGINIQFGGFDKRSNAAIMRRVESNIVSGKYSGMTDKKLESSEIIEMFHKCVEVINALKKHKYPLPKDDMYLFLMMEIDRIQKTYPDTSTMYSVGLEDYFIALELLSIQCKFDDFQHKCLFNLFRQVIVDGIYDDGNIDAIKYPIKLCTFLKKFSNVFTVNYDRSIENNVGTISVTHLHGDFETLGAYYNVKGEYYHTHKEECDKFIVSMDTDLPQCYSNAVMSWYWLDKYAELTDSDKNQCYGYDKFQSISGQLTILGLAPRNDEHLFLTINQNPNIRSVVFYYYDLRERDEIRKHIKKPITDMSVQKLWSQVED